MIRGTDALQTRKNSDSLTCLLRTGRHSHFKRKASSGVGNLWIKHTAIQLHSTEKLTLINLFVIFSSLVNYSSYGKKMNFTTCE